MIALAAFIFSTGGAAIKAADFGAWQIASFRSGVAALTLVVLLPAARRGFGWKPALVGVAYASTLISFVLANRLTTSANAIYLQSTAPLFLLLLGPWLLRERVTRRDVPILTAVLAGLMLVFMGNDAPSATAPNPALGNAVALVSGLSYALMLLGLRWLGKDGNRDAGLSAVVLGNGIAFLVGLPFAMPVGTHDPVSWSVILYLGTIQIALAYILVTKGLRHVPALDASLLLLVETACNPVWSWLVLSEVPSPWAIAGGVLIVAATVLQAARASTPAPVAEPA